MKNTKNKVSGWLTREEEKPQCLVKVSIAVTKHQDQKQFEEEIYWAYIPRDTQSIQGSQGKNLEAEIEAEPYRRAASSLAPCLAQHSLLSYISQGYPPTHTHTQRRYLQR